MNAKANPSMSSERRRWWRRVKPRGQAMVEYSIVSHFLLLGGGMALLPVIAEVLKALDIYYQGIYYILEIGAV